jgi:hypothetical protein
MTKAQWNRIIRSAAEITKKANILVVGSQSILGWHPELEHTFIAISNELDVEPEKATQEELDDINGLLGPEGAFALSNNGAYAEGVQTKGLVRLPKNWNKRLLRVESPDLITPSNIQAVAWCIHPNDLVVSKIVALRDKDLRFCRDLIRSNIPELNKGAILQGLENIEKLYPDKERHVEKAKTFIATEFSNKRQLRIRSPEETRDI